MLGLNVELILAFTLLCFLIMLSSKACSCDCYFVSSAALRSSAILYD